jgi:hypothetical protein
LKYFSPTNKQNTHRALRTHGSIDAEAWRSARFHHEVCACSLLETSRIDLGCTSTSKCLIRSPRHTKRRLKRINKQYLYRGSLVVVPQTRLSDERAELQLQHVKWYRVSRVEVRILIRAAHIQLFSDIAALGGGCGHTAAVRSVFYGSTEETALLLRPQCSCWHENESGKHLTTVRKTAVE